MALPGNVLARVKRSVLDASWFSMGSGAAASYLTLRGDVRSKNSNDTDAGESTADSDQKVRFSFSNTIVFTPSVGYSLYCATRPT